MAKSITVTLSDDLYAHLDGWADIRETAALIDNPDARPRDREILIGLIVREIVEGWVMQAADRIAKRAAQSAKDDDKGTPPIVNSA